MTTPSDILNKNFNKDLAAFNQDLNNYNGASQEAGSLKDAYKAELDGINWNGKNPWILLMTVMELVLNPGTNLMNNKIDSTGLESESQSALLKCQNDLQNITDTKGYGSAGVIAEARGLNELIAKLNGKQATDVFGQEGCANINDNLLTIRHQIYIGRGDKDYATDSVNNLTGGYYNSQTGTVNYYIAVDAQNPLNYAYTPNYGTKNEGPTHYAATSYDQAEQERSEQGHPNAIQMLTDKTNAFNTNTSVLQSVQQQTKEELTQWINIVKTLASAGSMFGHSISQVSSAAQQNMRPQ